MDKIHRPLKSFFEYHGKRKVPLISLRNAVVFPNIAMPLAVKRAKSLRALDFVLKKDRLVVFVAQKKAEIEEPKKEDLFNIGCLAKVKETVRQPDKSIGVIVEGIVRVKIKEFIQEEPFFEVKIEPLPPPLIKKTEKIEALMYGVVDQFKQAISLGVTVPFDVMLLIPTITNPWQLADVITLNLDLKIEEKQGILESNDVENKLYLLTRALARLIKVLKMSKKLQVETGKELGKMQREVFLREQLKAIEKELGILEGKSEIEELREKIEKAGMPKEIKEKALKELGRLEAMPSFSPEVSFVRTYLDWLCELPWSKKSKSKIDIKQAKKILDEDHYGLEKVKERVLEYLAVQKLVGKIKGPILCFVGPPGTGKTSIGKSIARALGRKFIRMSLGGIRDEAEIRGHRRTYVGALPGRIIQGIRNAGTKNPVFMLDEIDKVGADFRGDPSAALLEALDPEQNFAFSDHYLEVPFDLSDTMFITTANILDPIPPALKDRMEVIDFPGYIEDEKYHIAKEFLIPKQLKNHGLSTKTLIITDPAIHTIIREYTREAGVRNLEREISSVCRKVAKEIAGGKKKLYKVGIAELKKYIGPPKFTITIAEKKDEVGVATGLAWTPVGGEILHIEATKMPGKGNLILTGHLGKVMKESAQAAFSYARAKAKKLGIKSQFYKNSDIHIHVPSGAIPKDGPSAGVAMACVLVSILSNRKTRRTVGMTGEVTLRGQVLEVGGIKEKVLAAARGELKTVILPKKNKKDLEDVPKYVKKKLNFVFVEHMDEVLKKALV